MYKIIRYTYFILFFFVLCMNYEYYTDLLSITHCEILYDYNVSISIYVNANVAFLFNQFSVPADMAVPAGASGTLYW